MWVSRLTLTLETGVNPRQQYNNEVFHFVEYMIIVIIVAQV